MTSCILGTHTDSRINRYGEIVIEATACDCPPRNT